jgi:hypothetical protein
MKTLRCAYSVHSFLGAFAKLREKTISFVMTVSPFAWNLIPTERIFMKFDICVFFENMSWKFKFKSNLTSIMRIYIKANIYFWSSLFQFCLECKTFQIFLDKIKPHILWTIKFFKSWHIWDKVEKYLEPCSPQMTIWRISVVCWIPKTRKTHSEYDAYRFPTVNIVERTSLDVTSDVQCLSYSVTVSYLLIILQLLLLLIPLMLVVLLQLLLLMPLLTLLPLATPKLIIIRNFVVYTLTQ